jgi:hypothetical protein
MTLRRPHRFGLITALACALLVPGCEDEVTEGGGIPSDEQFLEATDAGSLIIAGGVNTNLGRFRAFGNLETLSNVEKRLRAFVPASVVEAVDYAETAEATYDSSAGRWQIQGSAASGDSLAFEYSATVAYFDSLGRPMPAIVDTLTERGALTESVDLFFRTGDFDGTASYEARLRMQLEADVHVGGTAVAPADTFFVTGTSSVYRRALAPDDTSEVGLDDVGMAGEVGPERSRDTRCFRANEFNLFWGRWRADVAITNAAVVRFDWLDPDETIGDRERIRFTQQVTFRCVE